MKGGQFAGLLTPLVGRLRHLLGVSDPLAYRVARQTRALCNFMKRLLVAKKHPPNLTYHFHSDHLLSPALKLGRGSKTPGSIFGRQNAYIWVTFRSVSTARYIRPIMVHPRHSTRTTKISRYPFIAPPDYCMAKHSLFFCPDKFSALPISD